MTTTELLRYHKELCDRARAIMRVKNHDYSGSSGKTPFANFEITEKMELTDTGTGILVRVVDKIQRIKTFIKVGTLLVKNESWEDAILDIINYMILLAGYFKQQREKRNRNN